MTPSSGIRARSDALHHHQRARGQPPACARLRRILRRCIRLRSGRRVRWRKCHQCPAFALQRQPCALWMLCIAISGQEVSRLSAPACGRILRRCIRLRSAFGSIAEGSAINARFTPSSGIRARSDASASPSAGKRSAAYLRPSAGQLCGSVYSSAVLRAVFAGGSAINAQLAPSSGIR